MFAQSLAPSHQRASAPSPEHQFVTHLFLLHTPIRLIIDKVRASVNQLTALAPDAHLDDLQRRLSHLANIVLTHCEVEDRTIFPALCSVSIRPVASPSSHPAKRRRLASSSPVSIDPQPLHDDHNQLRSAFDQLRTALADLRNAPFSRADSLHAHHTQLSPPFFSPSTSPGNPVPLAAHNHNGAAPQSAAASRQEGIVHVRELAERLAQSVLEHLESEESFAVPIATSYLSPTEQRQLILRVAIDTLSRPHLPDAFRLVPHDSLVSLLQVVFQYASDQDNKRIALALAKALPITQWRALCADIPTLAKMQLPKHNSLIEITQMHKAIRNELNDIVAYCKSIDTSSVKQMQNLANRVEFLRKVHSHHSEGEESVLLKELHAKISSSDSTATNVFHEEHDNEAHLFDDFRFKLDSLQRKSFQNSNDQSGLQAIKHELVKSVQTLSSHLQDHMDEEETKLLPLLRKWFSSEDQDRMMRLVMAKVPKEFLSEVIPWMFNSLEVDDQECMLRNLMRTAPPNEICKVISTIAQSVQKGMTDRMKWNEICLRVPEIEEDFKSIVDEGDRKDEGPVSEILRVHKAFRIELNTILRRTKELKADGCAPNPLMLNSLSESLAFLRKMVADHSMAEDEILLPKLETKIPGISERYKEDHCDEAQLFQEFADCLMMLRCATEESQCSELVQKLKLHARVLRDEMVEHLDLEEAQLWPLCRQSFDEKEQSEIVALIFGQMPSTRLRELLPWMIRLLSVSERNTMMNHILMVTKSTMFEKWLNSWLPLKAENAVEAGAHPEAKDAENQHSTQRDTESNAASTARAMLQGRENIERTIRSIARDSSLPVEERTRMMQRVIMALYYEQSSAAEGEQMNKSNDDLEKTYVKDKHGIDRLGCKHYRRNCKLRAACCQKLYNCRLCHDAKEQTHVMDRAATKEILCMLCSTVQPVAAVCVNEKCGKRFARYFCEICKFYDDRENTSVYHCHSCNVCRVGRGLGIDYFHCMKCNQCMHVKYRDKGHTCVQKSMESDCPVCSQYMFTSTSPVKYLRCGHLMHTSCYERFRANSISCPVCSRSLEEMSNVYERLEKQLEATGANIMPDHYRSARCDLYCKDCFTKSNTSYHFLYNKCPGCHSYNTRVEHIDPNGDESHVGKCNGR